MDKLVSAATFATANAVPSFAFGGKVAIVPVSGTTPVALGAFLAAKTSNVLFAVPGGHTLYVGHVDQVAGLSGNDARTLMFPLPASVFDGTIVDADEPGLVVMGDADFTLKILQAATVGAE